MSGIAAAQTAPVKAPASVTGVATPLDYVIGPEDVLGVLFWREPDISGDVTVRPDGMITVPLVGEIKAAGLKPEALRELIQKAAAKYLKEPTVSVPVKQINSRKVFVLGVVRNPAAYPLTGPRNVMQMITQAGGLAEYADSENIQILRDEQGRMRAYRFNYEEVAEGKKLEQNIQLQPGDTIVVR
jgi:polysaccharide export outer membrane protein